MDFALKREEILPPVFLEMLPHHNGNQYFPNKNPVGPAEPLKARPHVLVAKFKSANIIGLT